MYEKQAKEHNEEFSRVYDQKLNNLQSKLDAERQNQAGSIQELRELTTKVSALTTKNTELESSNMALQRRMSDVQRDMDQKDSDYRSEMARKVSFSGPINVGEIQGPCTKVCS